MAAQTWHRDGKLLSASEVKALLESDQLEHRLMEQGFRMPDRMKVRRSKNPFYLPLEVFHQRSQLRERVRMTLDPERVRMRGYFEPRAVSRLVDRMTSGEFLHLKQVLSLVILELWHMVFIDKQRLW